MMSNKVLLTVGNPNSGKTTLFNHLTGAKQAIGNWAGVTVEKKTGTAKIEDFFCHIIDLPGIYSFDNADSTSQDESITLNALYSLPCDYILNVIDASSLERGLYLTLQLRELGRPVLVILNKMDIVRLHGYEIDVEALASLLGCPVFDICSKSTPSILAFKANLAVQLKTTLSQQPLTINYDDQVKALLAFIEKNKLLDKPSRSDALRLLAGDNIALQQSNIQEKEALTKELAQLSRQIDVDLLIADARYSKVAEICHKCQKKVKSLTHKITDSIDNIVLHKYLGIPIFLCVMYLMFMFSINIGSAFIDFFDISVGAILVDGTHYLFDGLLYPWLVSLLADGIGAGIQTVATFIPVIACLYLFLSLLESSGYMARAAFVLDNSMQKIGLPGKAFVPLVLGFGCNVPSVMATRTLEKDHERYLAASMAPFMSCGARLPVYALFAAAFFPQNGQALVFLLYLLGIAVAIFTGFIFRKTLFPGNSTYLVMEIPSYELPLLRDILLKTWNKLKRFIFGAGKTIILVVTLLSFLNSVGTDGSFGNQNTQGSLLSKVAQFITPALAPIGIKEDNWQATVGIVTGLFAKEAVVGSLNSLYSTHSTDEIGEFSLFDSLKEALQSIPDNLHALSFSDPLGIDLGDLSKADIAAEQKVEPGIFNNLTTHFTTAGAFAYLVFILIYTPCAAALGAYMREFGRSFTILISSWTMMLAIVFATLSYQIAMFSQTPWQSTGWILFALTLLLSGIIGLVFVGQKRNKHLMGAKL